VAFDGLPAIGRAVAPRSIRGGIGPHLGWSAAHAELADVKTIKQAFGGTVGDVVLAVIAGAFRDLADLGEDPDDAVLRHDRQKRRWRQVGNRREHLEVSAGPDASSRVISALNDSRASSTPSTPTDEGWSRTNRSCRSANAFASASPS
jgi:hypothetical protein